VLKKIRDSNFFSDKNVVILWLCAEHSRMCTDCCICLLWSCFLP